MANVYDIIIRPIITERSMEATADKKYVFEVAPTAGKIEIKNAVEQIFGVKVAKVNTINYDGKTKRFITASTAAYISSTFTGRQLQLSFPYLFLCVHI